MLLELPIKTPRSLEGAYFNSYLEQRKISTMKAWKSTIDLASKTEEIFFASGDTLPPRFNVDSKDIKEGKQIGKGNWPVHEAQWLGRKVAVKKFHAGSTFNNVSLTSKEVNCMLGLQHPNVLKLWGFYLTAQKDLVLDCTMIMELMDCDLEGYIGRGPLSDDQVVYIIAEVARGMNHIHKKGFFHRDLKPKNVLLRKSIVTGFNVDVKIADFGSSELMGVGNIDRKVGTLGYKAPEQFECESKLFLDKVDVFGFGALCFKILTGKEPYESPKNVREVLKQIDRASISQRNIPGDVVEMIWECLDVDPDLRPNFEKICSILEHALSRIQEKMNQPVPLPTSPCLRSKESMLKGDQGHDQLERVLLKMGLSKEYGVHFIPFEELMVFQPIGQGGFGNVYRVEWKGILYALKVFGGFGKYPERYSFLGENYFQILPKLLHKNIVTFMAYSITPDDDISVVMELQEMNLSQGLLYYTARGSGHVLDFQKRWMILREIAEGMKYLHDQGVVHGDLKPSNVVLSSMNTNEMTVKLIDFSNDIQTFTRQYCAPERWKWWKAQRNDRYGEQPGSTFSVDLKKLDVYSFGIVCQEILGGASHLEELGPRDYREAILRGERPPIPIGTSPKMECLIKSCWHEDPQKRPNFVEVCEKLGSLDYRSCHGQNSPKCCIQRCCLL